MNILFKMIDQFCIFLATISGTLVGWFFVGFVLFALLSLVSVVWH